MDEPRPSQDQPEGWPAPQSQPASQPPSQPQDDTQQLFAYGAPTPPPPPPPPSGGYGYGPAAPYQGYGQYPVQDDPQQYPPPYAQQYGAYGAYPPPPPHKRRRSRGPVLVAAGTAIAIVFAAGIGGFALGRLHQSNASAGGGLGSGQAPHVQTPGQNGQNGQGGENGQGGFGNLAPFGNADPFGGNQQPSTSGNSTPATSDQLTGLVRVSTTLGYQQGAAAGTGMVLTSDGEVITNHHVVEGATDVKVTVMSTGDTYAAQVVGTDAKDDVAVLQLTNATGLATVTTDTTGVTVGDSVTAVGDAGGSETTFSQADGKVTATDQHITTHDADGSMGEKLAGLIEISSDVISGDSGGATYDDQGDVVGMTTAASTGSSDIVGYAIPISTVLQVADDLESHVLNARYAYGAPAFLGLGLSGNGTTVQGVYPGTPAARAGIAAGATITHIGGTSVSTAAGLKKVIQTYSPGDRVQITWTDAAGSSHSTTVTLIKGPIA
ncbi:MAG: S1C family serine protease [Nocardioides sp.]